VPPAHAPFHSRCLSAKTSIIRGGSRAFESERDRTRAHRTVTRKRMEAKPDAGQKDGSSLRSDTFRCARAFARKRIPTNRMNPAELSPILIAFPITGNHRTHVHARFSPLSPPSLPLSLPFADRARAFPPGASSPRIYRLRERKREREQSARRRLFSSPASRRKGEIEDEASAPSGNPRRPSRVPDDPSALFLISEGGGGGRERDNIADGFTV